MTPIFFPLELDNPNYEIQLEILGVEFLFRFKLNEVSDSWFVDILAIDGTCLRMGIPIVVGGDLFAGWQERERPEGICLTRVRGDVSDPPNRADMQAGRVDLLFIPFSEL